MPLQVESSAFAHEKLIPPEYTADGANVSPPLCWGAIPPGTIEFAIIMDDPDAPTTEPWVHWVAYSIPADVTAFPQGQPGRSLPKIPGGMKEGKNTFGNIGYGGPAPPRGHGVHRYFFKVFALDTMIHLPAGVTKADLFQAMQGHVLDQGVLMGIYER